MASGEVEKILTNLGKLSLKLNLSNSIIEFQDLLENKEYEVCTSIRVILTHTMNGNYHEEIGVGVAKNENLNQAKIEAKEKALKNGVERSISVFYGKKN
eukprot:gene4050-7339_t